MSSKKDFVFLPIVVWLLVLFVSYNYLGPFYAEKFTSDFWVFFVILIVVERLATAIGIVEICKKHFLNPDKWVLATLIFGVNTLLFINIKIWFQSSKK